VPGFLFARFFIRVVTHVVICCDCHVRRRPPTLPRAEGETAMRALMSLLLLSLAGLAHAQTAPNCATVPKALPINPSMLPAVAPELVAPGHQLGAPTGVLAQAFDEALAVDNVLLRLRIENCRSVANALPATSPASGIIDPATYKPRTQFDNTPWRFDMNQNGKRMTAEEFDAWMKARGVRVAKGATPAAAPAAPTTPDATVPTPTDTPEPAPAPTPEDN
jgi:hypothetical protein